MEEYSLVHFRGSSFLLVGPSLHNNLHLMRFSFIYRKGMGLLENLENYKALLSLRRFIFTIVLAKKIATCC